MIIREVTLMKKSDWVMNRDTCAPTSHLRYTDFRESERAPVLKREQEGRRGRKGRHGLTHWGLAGAKEPGAGSKELGMEAAPGGGSGKVPVGPL